MSPSPFVCIVHTQTHKHFSYIFCVCAPLSPFSFLPKRTNRNQAYHPETNGGEGSTSTRIQRHSPLVQSPPSSTLGYAAWVLNNTTRCHTALNFVEPCPFSPLVCKVHYSQPGACTILTWYSWACLLKRLWAWLLSFSNCS